MFRGVTLVHNRDKLSPRSNELVEDLIDLDQSLGTPARIESKKNLQEAETGVDKERKSPEAKAYYQNIYRAQSEFLKRGPLT